MDMRNRYAMEQLWDLGRYPGYGHFGSKAAALVEERVLCSLALGSHWSLVGAKSTRFNPTLPVGAGVVNQCKRWGEGLAFFSH